MMTTVTVALSHCSLQYSSTKTYKLPQTEFNLC